MPERRDYLPVCNDHGVPLTEFQQTFCVRCVQPECSRSQAGGIFQTRVVTWQDRLFENPPRMRKDDPLYAAISAKRFMEIDGGAVPEFGAKQEWVDPRAVEEPKPTPKPRKAKAPPAKPEARVEPSKVERPTLQRQAGLNTPFQQGAMLEGPAAALPKKPADPWAAPVTSTPARSTPANLVKPGARIKFT